jgi:hypothetical protein
VLDAADILLPYSPHAAGASAAAAASSEDVVEVTSPGRAAADERAVVELKDEHEVIDLLDDDEDNGCRAVAEAVNVPVKRERPDDWTEQ